MATTSDQTDADDRRTIVLRAQPEGGWTAIDEDTGVASQGTTREQALDNLDEALDAYHGRNTTYPSDSELREMGVDPETARAQGDLPDVLK